MEQDAVEKFHVHDLRIQRLEDSQQMLNDTFVKHMRWEEASREGEKIERQKLEAKLDRVDTKLSAIMLDEVQTKESQKSFKAQIVIAVTVTVGLVSLIQSAVMIYLNIGKF